MADGGSTQIGGLEIEISASSTDAAKKIDDLAAALERISKVNASGKNLENTAKKLDALKNALSGLQGENKIGQLAEGLQKLSQVGEISLSEKTTEKIQNLGAAIKDLPDGKNLAAIAGSLGALSNLSKISIPKSLPDRLRELGQSMESVSDDAIARLERATDALQKVAGVDLRGIGSAVRSTSRGGKESGAAAETPTVDASETAIDSGIGNSEAKVQKFSGVLEWLKTTAAGAGNVLKNGLGGGLQFTANLFEKTLSVTKKFGAGLLELGRKGAVIAFKSLGGFINNQFISPIKSAIRAFTTWKNSIGRIAFYRLIRSAIKAVTDGFREGMDNLYQYSNLVGTKFAPAMNQLATSSLYLKNSLGAMAAPLIQAVAPAIDKLVEKFVVLLNTIGKLFAALTGQKTYSQAVKQATTYADATEKATDAAKEFQKYLIGIDELTIISDDKNKDFGSGTNTPNYGTMFEEVEIPDWMKEIREAIENGDWYGAGVLLAEKLNSVIEQWDARAWGEKLGGYIQNGIEFALGFMRTMAWDVLGEKVADFINGGFNAINPNDLGALIASKVEAALEFAYGFVTKFEWAEFGDWLGNVVNGWFDEIDWELLGKTISDSIEGLLTTGTNFLKKVDWEQIGEDIATMLINIDWKGLWNSFLEAGKAAISSVTGLIDGLNEKTGWFGTLVGDIGLALGAWTISKEVINFFNNIADKKIFGMDKALTLTITIAGFAFEFGGAYDIGYNGPNLQNIIQTALGSALGLAGSLLTFGTGPLGWAVGVGLSLTVGITAMFKGASDRAIQEYYDSEAYAQIQSIIAEASKSESVTKQISLNVETRLKNYEEFKSSLDGVIAMIDRIFELDAIEVKTNDQLSELSRYVDIVNGLNLDGLHIDLDPDGKIVQTKEQLLQITDELLKQAQLEAAYGNIVQAYQEQSAAVRELAEGQRQLTDAQAALAAAESEYETASERYNAAVRTATSVGDYFLLSTLDERAALDAATEALQKARDAHDQAANSVDSAKKAIEDTQAEIDYYNSEFASMGQTVDSTMSGVKAAVESAMGGVKIAFSGAQVDVSGSMGGMKDAAKSGSAEAYNAVNDNLPAAGRVFARETGEMAKQASYSFRDIRDGMTGNMDDATQGVETKVGSMSKWLSDTFGGLAGSAATWGADLCAGIANGIASGVQWVIDAASSVANWIASFLHFSEPDRGPLSNFHTFMPDMLREMANGIDDNAYLAVNAISSLTNQIADEYGNLSFSTPEIQMPSHEDMQMNYRVAYENTSRANRQDGGSITDGMRGVNEDVISVIFAAAQQIVRAIDEKDTDTYMDGRLVTKDVTSMQNREARIYGKPVQTV